MGKFAVIQNNEVVNLILAESKEDAENVTSLECVEYDENTVKPFIGGTYIDNVFEELPVEPQPETPVQ
jgi:hypothetical protein